MQEFLVLCSIHYFTVMVYSLPCLFVEMYYNKNQDKIDCWLTMKLCKLRIRGSGQLACKMTSFLLTQLIRQLFLRILSFVADSYEVFTLTAF